MSNQNHKIARTNHNVGLIFNLPIWGDSFIDRAKRFLFPSLFSTASLNALRQKTRFLIIIDTDHESFSSLENYLSNSKLKCDEFILRKTFSDSFSVKKNKYGDKKYSRVTESQLMSMKFARENKFEFFVPLYADFVLPQNFISSLILEIQKNTYYWLTLVPAVETAKFTELFNSKVGKNSSKCISSQSLHEMIGRSLHPLFFKSILGFCETFHPVGPYLGIGDKNAFAMKSFHYHPIFMRITDGLNLEFEGTIDAHFIPQLQLSSLTCSFNDFGSLSLASLMDEDYPMPYFTVEKHIDFYKTMALSSPNFEQTQFVLRHTTCFRFEKSNVAADHVERLSDFTSYLVSLVAPIKKQTTLGATSPAKFKKFSVVIRVILIFIGRLLPREVRYKLMNYMPNRFWRFIFQS